MCGCSRLIGIDANAHRQALDNLREVAIAVGDTDYVVERDSGFKSEGPVAEAGGKLEGFGGREHRSLISEDSGNSWQSPVLGCR